jgi:hypothetical protein
MQTFTKDQEDWLKELESGNYEQAEGVLCDGTGFCCLGVACEFLGTYKQEVDERVYYGVNPEEGEAPEEVYMKLDLYDGCGSLNKDRLPEEVFEKLDEFDIHSLAEMNDSGQYTFRDIAAFIRKFPESVFKPTVT